MLGKLVLALFIAAAPGTDKKDDSSFKDLGKWEVLSGSWKIANGELQGISGGGDGLYSLKAALLRIL
jgi:hypothetical protein